MSDIDWSAPRIPASQMMNGKFQCEFCKGRWNLRWRWKFAKFTICSGCIIPALKALTDDEIKEEINGVCPICIGEYEHPLTRENISECASGEYIVYDE